MIPHFRHGRTSGLIRLLLSIAFVFITGCGSQHAARPGPPFDKDLERTNRAARTAFENGRFRQAADLYRQTLERAYLRDDMAAAIDARYNLALCLTNLQSDREALTVVLKAREDLMRAEQRVPTDILLLEATILYRLDRSQEAWRLTEDIFNASNSIPAAVQSKTHYLRGLIANQKDDPAKLKQEITALTQSDSLVIRADREELIGHLSIIERRWDDAVLAFDEAATLRRKLLDYRGMVSALAKAGEACERNGRYVPASKRYLRAGQSAALQKYMDRAQLWLNRAAQLAEKGGNETIAKEARRQLVQLQKEQSIPSEENEAIPQIR